MHPALTARIPLCLGMAAAAWLGWVPWACAQDRGSSLSASYPFVASALNTKGAQGEAGAAAHKNMSEPVWTTIAPSSPSPAIVLPERRTAVDQMLQSHEFTFGTSGRASGTSGKRLIAGSGMDLDAIKLRVSRDKVLLKAEWSFN